MATVSISTKPKQMEEKQTPATLNNLPYDITRNIIQYLSSCDKMCLRNVCTSLRGCVEDRDLATLLLRWNDRVSRSRISPAVKQLLHAGRIPVTHGYTEHDFNNWEGRSQHTFESISERLALGRERPERIEIMQRLNRDDPQTIPCFACLELHTDKYLLRDPSCAWKVGFISLDLVDKMTGVTAKLGFHHVQLAMRAFRLGLNYESILRRIPLGNGKAKYRWSYFPNNRHQSIDVSTRMKIVQGRLLHRTSAYIEFTTASQNSLHEALNRLDGESAAFNLISHGCRDLRDHYQRLKMELRKKLEKKVFKTREQLLEALSSLRRCDICHREIQLSIERRTQTMFRLTLTAWADLGAGDDPGSETWLTSCSFSGHIEDILERRGELPSSQSSKHLIQGAIDEGVQPWSIKVMFESDEFQPPELDKWPLKAPTLWKSIRVLGCRNEVYKGSCGCGPCNGHMDLDFEEDQRIYAPI